VSETVGEVEVEDGVLIIRRIHTNMILKGKEADRETVMRVHGFFADKCPVYRSLKAAIQITTSVTLEPEAEDMMLGDQGQSGG
jgi:uncharacterized OsmC-like protein